MSKVLTKCLREIEKRKFADNNVNLFLWEYAVCGKVIYAQFTALVRGRFVKCLFVSYILE